MTEKIIFWGDDELTRLDTLKNSNLEANPDLIARMWYGLIKKGREDIIYNTGACAIRIYHDHFVPIEDDIYTHTKHKPLCYYPPILGEFVFMYQNLRYFFKEYTIEEHIEFVRKTLTIAIKASKGIPIEGELDEETKQLIETAISGFVVPEALNKDALRLRGDGFPIRF